MAYLGNSSLPFDPTRTAAQPRDAERFSGNGSTVNFTLSRTVNNLTDVEVFVENVQQEPIVAYNIVGTTLSFTEAPPSGSQNIYVIYRAFNTGAQVYVPDGSITYAKLANNLKLFTSDNLTPNGNNSVFTLSDTPPDANTVIVSVDGIVQRAPVHYTISGQTITFTSPPPAGSNVHVRHLGIRTTQTLTAIAANTTIPQPTITGQISGNPFFNNKLGIGVNNTIADTELQVYSANTTSKIRLQNSTTTSSTGRGLAIQQVGVDTYITNNEAGSMYLYSGASNAGIRVTQNGYVLKPNLPAFSVDGATFSGKTFLGGTTTYVNNGSHFNASNGRFTAPVAGLYLFSFSLTTEDSNSHFVNLILNGVAIQGGNVLQYYNVYTTATNVMILNLLQGDYVTAERRDSTGYAVYYARFAGYLLG